MKPLPLVLGGLLLLILIRYVPSYFRSDSIATKVYRKIHSLPQQDKFTYYIKVVHLLRKQGEDLAISILNNKLERHD